MNVMAENFPELLKDTNPQIWGRQKIWRKVGERMEKGKERQRRRRRRMQRKRTKSMSRHNVFPRK